MGRPEGSRNPGYEKRRATLARRALPRLLKDDGTRVSLNDLAVATRVSVPTLKHYFGDRAGLVAAALAGTEELAAENVALLAAPSSGDFGRSLRDAGTMIVEGWTRFGVDRFFTVGLALGVYEPAAGPAYLSGILEPTQQAIEKRLRLHALRGQADIPAGLERTAALAFLAPLVLALLHQGPLSGATCRPLDVHAFLAAHVTRFVRAWGPTA